MSSTIPACSTASRTVVTHSVIPLVVGLFLFGFLPLFLLLRFLSSVHQFVFNVLNWISTQHQHRNFHFQSHLVAFDFKTTPRPAPCYYTAVTASMMMIRYSTFDMFVTRTWHNSADKFSSASAIVSEGKYPKLAQSPRRTCREPSA